jgi:quercetin dioxygenase-like cupin family protein
VTLVFWEISMKVLMVLTSNSRLVVLLAAALSFLSAMSDVVHAAPPDPQIQREVIQRTPISSPGLELIAYRITVPPGASAPPHCHPAVGMGYVIEGEFESQFLGGPITQKRAGDSFMDEAVTEHVLFRNPSKTVSLVMVVVYVLPPGTPQLQPGQSCRAPAATTKGANE